jgi:hypothetical protein
MCDADIILIFYLLNGDPVMLIRSFRLRRHKL